MKQHVIDLHWKWSYMDNLILLGIHTVKNEAIKMRHTQLECIVFRKKENVYEFLLLKRIPEKGGFWQPPCGGLEGEESKLDAAHRELLEVTSISKEHILRVIENVDTFTIDKHYLTGEPISPITEHVFGFEVSPEMEISIHNNIYPEHEKFEWVTFEAALEMLKWENNKEALTKLNQLLK